MNFKNKIILITGGTGSFGNAMINKLLKTEINQIRIFSRDEKKQDDMRKLFKSDKLKFYLGDVRDINSIKLSMKGVDFVFHAAALKQVPSCEFYPIEAVKTNVFGTENVLTAAIQHHVKKVICLSTDKAVYPINAMGVSKAMMEKISISKFLNNSSTSISITRYGNVIASRGSVIPAFIKMLLEDRPITITDPNMTRFMMSLDEAINLVFFALKKSNSGEIFVQKSPSATIKNITQALIELFNKKKHKIIFIGKRHGEKNYESLLTDEEMSKAIDLGNYYKIPPDLRDLNYDDYFEKGDSTLTEKKSYNSNNTKLMNVEEVKELLIKIPCIKSLLNQRYQKSNL